MWRGFSHLLKKDFRMMISGKFFLLALLSLCLYSGYINFVYAKLDQKIFPVCLYDPQGRLPDVSEYVIKLDSREALKAACADQYSVGIDLSRAVPEI